jgi:hypothetical protein
MSQRSKGGPIRLHHGLAASQRPRRVAHILFSINEPFREIEWYRPFDPVFVLRSNQNIRSVAQTLAKSP